MTSKAGLVALVGPVEMHPEKQSAAATFKGGFRHHPRTPRDLPRVARATLGLFNGVWR